MKNALAVALLFSLTSCSDSSTSSGGTKQVCLTTGGQPTTCPVTVSGSACSAGDANACAPVTLEELRSGGTPATTCLRVVIANQCGQEIYSDTCIEYVDDTGMKQWQCWRSSTLSKDSIDVAQCGATGRYFHYHSTSSAEIDLEAAQCPMPT